MSLLHIRTGSYVVGGIQGPELLIIAKINDIPRCQGGRHEIRQVSGTFTRELTFCLTMLTRFFSVLMFFYARGDMGLGCHIREIIQHILSSVDLHDRVHERLHCSSFVALSSGNLNVS